MKTTIKINAMESIEIDREEGGRVRFSGVFCGKVIGSRSRSQGECEELISAIRKTYGGCTGNCNQGRACACRAAA